MPGAVRERGRLADRWSVSQGRASGDPQGWLGLTREGPNAGIRRGGQRAAHTEGERLRGGGLTGWCMAILTRDNGSLKQPRLMRNDA